MTPARGGPGKALGLALASLVLSLALAEGLLRVFRPAPQFRRLSFVDDGSTYVLSPNRKLVYEPKPDAGPFNAYGHRGPAFPYEKGLKKRIVFMGDSVLEGLGVEPAERFTELLNERLGHGFEVVNFGVEGYSFAQEFEYFKDKVLRFSPDLVLWCLTSNDLSEASSELTEVRRLAGQLQRDPSAVQSHRGWARLEKVLRLSHVYRQLDYLLRYAPALPGRPEEARAAEALARLRRLAREQGFQVSFVLLPVNVGDGRNDLLKLAPLLRKARLAFVDLDARLPGGPAGKKSLFLPNDPCHLSRKGHQAVAELLFEQLRGKSRAD